MVTGLCVVSLVLPSPGPNPGLHRGPNVLWFAKGVVRQIWESTGLRCEVPLPDGPRNGNRPDQVWKETSHVTDSCKGNSGPTRVQYCSVGEATVPLASQSVRLDTALPSAHVDADRQLDVSLVDTGAPTLVGTGEYRERPFSPCRNNSDTKHEKGGE
ncbi:hypothetical protein BC826DRAFT_970352 [Russula brevipes]|nr:hypothetical protein BC826DRAFT_970352 [Russula brevipes]